MTETMSTADAYSESMPPNRDDHTAAAQIHIGGMPRTKVPVLWIAISLLLFLFLFFPPLFLHNTAFGVENGFYDGMFILSLALSPLWCLPFVWWNHKALYVLAKQSSPSKLDRLWDFLTRWILGSVLFLLSAIALYLLIVVVRSALRF